MTKAQKVGLLRAFGRFVTDRDVSLLYRSCIGLVGPGYIVSPIDIVPDMLPGGLIDDVVMVVIIVASIWKYRHSLHPRRV